MINQSKTEIHGLNKTTVREMADWCWEGHVTRGVWGVGGCCLATGLGVKVPCKLFERSQNTSLLVVDEINNCSVLPFLILLHIWYNLSCYKSIAGNGTTNANNIVVEEYNRPVRLFNEMFGNKICCRIQYEISPLKSVFSLIEKTISVVVLSRI